MKHLSVSELNCILNPRPPGRVDEPRSAGAGRASRGRGRGFLAGEQPSDRRRPCVFSQCEECLCWQHSVCMGLLEESIPEQYVCYICRDPPGKPEPRVGGWTPEDLGPSPWCAGRRRHRYLAGPVAFCFRVGVFEYFSLSVAVLFSMLMTWAKTFASFHTAFRGSVRTFSGRRIHPFMCPCVLISR